MQSETQTVREDSSAHHCPARVRHQSAIDTTHSVADDFKTFRIAVVIGLVMVGGLSLFLPDKTGCPTYEVMAPASLESLDLAQHASTNSERTQSIIVERRQGNETAGQPEIRAQLATLARVVPSPEDEKRQAGNPNTIPVVRTPALQTDVVSLQR